jgi:hypothetical protein
MQPNLIIALKLIACKRLNPGFSNKDQRKDAEKRMRGQS